MPRGRSCQGSEIARHRSQRWDPQGKQEEASAVTHTCSWELHTSEAVGGLLLQLKSREMLLGRRATIP